MRRRRIRGRPFPGVRVASWLAAAGLSSTSALAQQPPPYAQPAPQPPPYAQPAPVAPGPRATPAAPAPPAAAPTVAITDAAATGVDPRVGLVVTDQVARTATELGFAVTPAERTRAAVAQLGIRRAPTAADAWNVARITRSDMAVSASATAAAGAYVIKIELARRDGSGPFAANGSAGAHDLRAVVTSMTRTLLMPYAPGASDSTPDGDAEREEEPLSYRWRLAGQTEASFALSPGFAYAHLVGARLDHQFLRGLFLGPYAGYVNLEGPDGRVHNALVMLQAEYRVQLGESGVVGMPLKFATGYLPQNGPVLRGAAGLAFTFDDSVTLGVDLFSPMLWIVRNRSVFSLDVALDLAFAL